MKDLSPRMGWRSGGRRASDQFGWLQAGVEPPFLHLAAGQHRLNLAPPDLAQKHHHRIRRGEILVRPGLDWTLPDLDHVILDEFDVGAVLDVLEPQLAG